MGSTEAVAALSLNAHQARLLHLAAQGLLRPPRARATRTTLLAAIVRMQLLQIDTIHVVARSPYLVLHSRVGAYPMIWLEELLARGAIAESWAHEACFVPACDLPLHRSNVIGTSTHWALKHARRMQREHGQSLSKLLAHIGEVGPVKAADFERKDGIGGGWWGWKEEKRWLEALFALGELMIARRENFHRVYDLRERVMPRIEAGWPRWAQRLRGSVPSTLPAANATLPEADEVRRQFMLKAVQALGIAQARWIADYFRSGRKHKDGELDALVESGQLLRVTVRGWEHPGYVHPDNLALAQRAAAGRLRASHTTLLSPFDPVVWDRARARALFDFDYRIECYTPDHKRQHGYFVLPILHEGRLVGRLDAKAHRAAGRFEVKALFLEDGVVPDERLASALAGAILASATWHETPQVQVKRCEPHGFLKMLRAALKAHAALL